MWWNDIKRLQEQMCRVCDHIEIIETRIYLLKEEKEYEKEYEEDILESIEHRLEELEELEEIEESVDDVFCSDDESSSIDRIHDKLNALIHQQKSLVDLYAKLDEIYKSVLRNETQNQRKESISPQS